LRKKSRAPGDFGGMVKHYDLTQITWVDASYGLVRLGCVMREPLAQPQPLSQVLPEACAKACEGFPYFFLDDGACSCASAYNSSATNLPQSETCNGMPVAYTTSRCALGATFQVVNAKKEKEWQAQVRFKRWLAGSTVTLHWGRVHSAFRSAWNGKMLAKDPWKEWQAHKCVMS